MNPSVSSLIGKVSANSDMQISHNRNRYLTTTTVFPNQYFRMLVPKLGPNALLDCRNIRMRFTLTITSTDAGIAVDSNLTHPFQRCRILSGSTVLYDLDNSLLAMTAIYNAATHTAATYALSSIEILSEYINSPSLAAYFRANPMAFTVNDYSWRYQTIDQQTSQVRLSSSSTSLNGFIMMLRDQNVETKFDNQDKVAVYNANDIDYENLLLNQVRFFDENIDSYPQFFRELKHLIPEAEHAVYFDSTFSSTRFLIGVRISAAPNEFAGDITSGVKTSSLNNDLVEQLRFKSVLSGVQRVDTFLQSDVHPGSLDLMIKY